MFNGLVATEQVNFIFVFLEGLISFFSPCVIPLIPIYISYLTGNTMKTDENGMVTYAGKNVFFHTLFFVLGISAAFFLLGISFSALGIYLNQHKVMIARIGGIIILLLGLFQLGVFNFRFLQKERKFHMNFKFKKMTPLIAFAMGFTFSFAWTPCVGPALSSVLILASGATSAWVGNLLVLVYTLGFIIPFLLLGIFTAKVLNFLRTRRNFMKYTVKIGGILLVIIGIMTLTGWMNGITSYLNSFTPSSPPQTEASPQPVQTASPAPASTPAQSSDKIVPAFDFSLRDQYGNLHTLSDYKGKVVFLNFWATWCPPCRSEMPHIQELYQQYGENSGDLVILGISNPKTAANPQAQDKSPEEITAFLKENGYSFPSVFDETGEVFTNYYISSFPTTFMIGKDGNIFGYVSGALTKDMMLNIIRQTMENS